MAIRRWATFSIALGLGIHGLWVRAQGTIPRAHGTTLAGVAVALPDAVKGKAGVLVVGFSKASQTQVATWGRRLAGDYGKSDRLAYFEIPMLARAPKLLRGMIVRQMGSTVPEGQRTRFLPLMEGEAAWKAVAHFIKPDDAYVLLIDGDGTVEWQTEGDATDAAYRALQQHVEKVSATMAGH